ncbi:MAG: 23S rRNA (guanosine(2251)-2'-O)-methyltransferase RlmB [Bacilli bacterium]|jgi:23S rRNA (guanosine2251-2'-O)-methyltransferase
MTQYIYGKNAVLARIEKQEAIEELYVYEGMKDQRFLARLSALKFKKVSRQQLEQLCGNPNHQGVVAKIQEYKYAPLEEVIALANTQEYPLLVMLDGIEDPHNLGAILRTCEAIGVKGVIVHKYHSAPLSSTVAKVSTGAIEYVKVAQVANLTTTLKRLKKEGYWVVGAEASGPLDYRAVDYKTKIVLVIGSEGYGIAPLVFKQCDFKVHLPMEGKINSLNASNATAILLYAIHSNRYPIK